MATKKTAKKSTKRTKKTVDVSEAYWEHLLEHGSKPASVFKFCKDHGLKEGDFYREFGSFEALERQFWAQTVKDTISIVESDPEAAEYDARQLMLAFYFTYFEQALEYRSRFLLRFPCLRKGSANLKEFEHAFSDFAEKVIHQGRAEGQMADLKQLNSLQEKGLYPQFRFLLDFHLKDSSKGFQDTDALIEKSVRFYFDAARFPVIESTVDLFRFLLPRLRQS